MEQQVKKDVRELVEDRDGHCRFGPAQSDVLYLMFGSCNGPSEWAHLEEKRRGRTRGMEAEERHTTGGSAKMCQRHHQAYDAGEFKGAFRTQRGADGPMVWYTAERIYMEGL